MISRVVIVIINLKYKLIKINIVDKNYYGASKILFFSMIFKLDSYIFKNVDIFKSFSYPYLSNFS